MIFWITICYKQALRTHWWWHYSVHEGFVWVLCLASTRLKWKCWHSSTLTWILGKSLLPGLKPAQSNLRQLSKWHCSIHLQVQEWTRGFLFLIPFFFQEEKYLVFSSQIIQFGLTVYILFAINITGVILSCVCFNYYIKILVVQRDIKVLMVLNNTGFSLKIKPKSSKNINVYHLQNVLIQPICDVLLSVGIAIKYLRKPC